MAVQIITVLAANFMSCSPVIWNPIVVNYMKKLKDKLKSVPRENFSKPVGLLCVVRAPVILYGRLPDKSHVDHCRNKCFEFFHFKSAVLNPLVHS